MMRRRLVPAAVALAVLGLNACGSDDDADMPAMDEEATSPVADDEATTSGEESSNDADVMFAKKMIPHHRQAVEMAEMVEGSDASPEVEDLAGRIQAAQDPEIETMTGWLEEWDELADGGGMDMDEGGMSGMMSEDEMSEMMDSSGVEFDQMFLESMKAHHEGAIEMAETEVAEGEYPPAIELAEEIIDAQRAEIEEIDELLSSV